MDMPSDSPKKSLVNEGIVTEEVTDSSAQEKCHQRLNEIPPDIQCQIHQIPERKLPFLIDKRRLEPREDILDIKQLSLLKEARAARAYLNVLPSVFSTVPQKVEPCMKTLQKQKNSHKQVRERSIKRMYSAFEVPKHKEVAPTSLTPAPTRGPYALFRTAHDKLDGPSEVEWFQIEDSLRLRDYQDSGQQLPPRVGSTVHSEWRRLRFRCENGLDYKKFQERMERAKYNACLKVSEMKQGRVGIKSVQLTSIEPHSPEPPVQEDHTDVTHENEGSPDNEDEEQVEHKTSDGKVEHKASDGKVEHKASDGKTSDQQKTLGVQHAKKKSTSKLREAVRPLITLEPMKPRINNTPRRKKKENSAKKVSTAKKDIKTPSNKTKSDSRLSPKQESANSGEIINANTNESCSKSVPLAIPYVGQFRSSQDGIVTADPHKWIAKHLLTKFRSTIDSDIAIFPQSSDSAKCHIGSPRNSPYSEQNVFSTNSQYDILQSKMPLCILNVNGCVRSIRNRNNNSPNSIWLQPPACVPDPSTVKFSLHSLDHHDLDEDYELRSTGSMNSSAVLDKSIDKCLINPHQRKFKVMKPHPNCSTIVEAMTNRSRCSKPRTDLATDDSRQTTLFVYQNPDDADDLSANHSDCSMSNSKDKLSVQRPKVKRNIFLQNRDPQMKIYNKSYNNMPSDFKDNSSSNIDSDDRTRVLKAKRGKAGNAESRSTQVKEDDNIWGKLRSLSEKNKRVRWGSVQKSGQRTHSTGRGEKIKVKAQTSRKEKHHSERHREQNAILNTSVESDEETSEQLETNTASIVSACSKKTQNDMSKGSGDECNTTSVFSEGSKKPRVKMKKKSTDKGLLLYVYKMPLNDSNDVREDKEKEGTRKGTDDSKASSIRKHESNSTGHESYVAREFQTSPSLKTSDMLSDLRHNSPVLSELKNRCDTCITIDDSVSDRMYDFTDLRAKHRLDEADDFCQKSNIKTPKQGGSLSRKYGESILRQIENMLPQDASDDGTPDSTQYMLTDSAISLLQSRISRRHHSSCTQTLEEIIHKDHKETSISERGQKQFSQQSSKHTNKPTGNDPQNHEPQESKRPPISPVRRLPKSASDSDYSVGTSPRMRVYERFHSEKMNTTLKASDFFHRMHGKSRHTEQDTKIKVNGEILRRHQSCGDKTIKIPKKGMESMRQGAEESKDIHPVIKFQINPSVQPFHPETDAHTIDAKHLAHPPNKSEITVSHGRGETNGKELPADVSENIASVSFGKIKTMARFLIKPKFKTQEGTSSNEKNPNTDKSLSPTRHERKRSPDNSYRQELQNLMSRCSPFQQLVKFARNPFSYADKTSGGQSQKWERLVKQLDIQKAKSHDDEKCVKRQHVLSGIKEENAVETKRNNDDTPKVTETAMYQNERVKPNGSQLHKPNIIHGTPVIQKSIHASISDTSQGFRRHYSLQNAIGKPKCILKSTLSQPTFVENLIQSKNKSHGYTAPSGTQYDIGGVAHHPSEMVSLVPVEYVLPPCQSTNVEVPQNGVVVDESNHEFPSYIKWVKHPNSPKLFRVKEAASSSSLNSYFSCVSVGDS